jgi:hypothetical protein
VNDVVCNVYVSNCRQGFVCVLSVDILQMKSVRTRIYTEAKVTCELGENICDDVSAPVKIVRLIKSLTGYVITTIIKRHASGIL